jgi:ABC-type transport system involved in cytochrome c biogenesis permease subunit
MSTEPTPHAPGEHGEPPARAAAAPGSGALWAGVRKVLKPIASLQLTVALFVVALGLVFFGTLAQIDHGIWTVVDRYFWSWVVEVPFDLIRQFLSVFWSESFPPGGDKWGGWFPFPAGKLLGLLMLTNLLAAHAVRFRMTWKRAGIFLTHFGLILLFAGEFITREYAIEQQMSIAEGQTVAYAEDTRNLELVFTDRTDAKEDKVVTLSERRLRRARPGERISHPDLPVDVEVLKYFKNSNFREPKPGDANLATAGFGLNAVAEAAREESGVATRQQQDISSAYVALYRKDTGDKIGVYLVSLIATFNGGDLVPVGPTTHHVALRRARYNKPYSLTLVKFKFDRYLGTDKPKNFSSEVIVRDATGAVARENVVISMNNPLRYAGETFYQADWDKATERGTVLQVVKNPGWIDFWLFQASVDYIACTLVGVGLVLHFLISLIGFVRRLAPRPAVVPTGAAKWTGIGITAVAALYVLSMFGRMYPPKVPVDYRGAGAIPVVDGGRVKPLDSIARVFLRLISHREEVVDADGTKRPAIHWYLDVIAAGDLSDDSPAWQHRVFRVENPDLARELKLEHRDGLRYSYAELRERYNTVAKLASAARMKENERKQLEEAGKPLPPLDEGTKKFDTKAIELEQHMGMVEQLHEFRGFDARKNKLLLLPPTAEGGEWGSLADLRDRLQIAPLIAAQAKLLADPKRLQEMTPAEKRQLVRDVVDIDVDNPPPGASASSDEIVRRTLELLRADPGRLPPTIRPRVLKAVTGLLKPEDRAAFQNLPAEPLLGPNVPPAATEWGKLVTAYRGWLAADAESRRIKDRAKTRSESGDAARLEALEAEGAKFAEAFGTSVTALRNERHEFVPAEDLRRSRAELFYNRFAPFYQCTGLYVLAFVLAVVGLGCQAADSPAWGAALRRSAFAITAGTLVLHTVALFARMFIMDRPGVFVTNLYSSAIFIGWGCVALCVLIERMFPFGVGTIMAAKLGLATCIVGHNIAGEDTMEMLQAVLDTNFWLATHVTTVTLGYTATFVAGFFGALYVFQMLGAVVRDSYQMSGEPSVGALLAFGAAATGVIAVPLVFLAFMVSALDKFEVLPSMALWSAYYVLLAFGVVYALTLMLLRIGAPGIDAAGRPVAGELPKAAKPVAALALTAERGKVFGQVVYGIVCFATLLSFVGTVLGGIWADQSWGRFWGWDPKENGAVLIVIWNALILHARWAGLVKDRGVAVLAIFGNAITAWSWFGTNQLSIGLHAYGFDSRLADGCFNFWLSQFFILGLGLIPARFWASAARRTPLPAQPAGTPEPSAPVPSAPAPSAPSTNGHSANGNGHAPRDKGRKSKRK